MPGFEDGSAVGVGVDLVECGRLSRGKRCQLQPGMLPLLNSMERNGLSHRSSCRTGVCADCCVRVLEGATFEVSSCVRQADRALGYVHACTSYPLEDLIIEL